MQNRGNMRRIRKAQEEARQKKLRDTPHGRDIELGKTTAAQYNAAYGTAPGANEKLKPINKRAYMVSKKNAAAGVLSNKSASVVPDDETAAKIKAKRKPGIIKKTAVTHKSTPVTTNKSTPVTTNKGPTATSTTSVTKKKRKKHTKRAARERFREAQKGKKPKTKKTTKTTKQKELEAAYGSPKDTERMMKGKPLKESWGSKLKKKFGKGK